MPASGASRFCIGKWALAIRNRGYTDKARLRGLKKEAGKLSYVGRKAGIQKWDAPAGFNRVPPLLGLSNLRNWVSGR